MIFVVRVLHQHIVEGQLFLSVVVRQYRSYSSMHRQGSTFNSRNTQYGSACGAPHFPAPPRIGSRVRVEAAVFSYVASVGCWVMVKGT